MPTKPTQSCEQAANRAANSDEQAANVRGSIAANGGEPFAAQWLTVTEVADLLGLTPRTIQKRCKAGKLDARSVETPTGEQWEINAASVETQSKQATNEAANRATNGCEQATNVRSEQPRTAANSSQLQDADSREDIADRDAAAPYWKEREVELKEEIRWLRNANEQHQRDSIELRQLLKKALEIAPRQLVQGTPDEATPTSPTAQDAPPVDTVPSPTPERKQSVRTQKELRPIWKVILGLR